MPPSERNYTVIDCDQRSDDWHAARLGRLTGSRAGDMLAKIKSGEAAARRDLRIQLVCERLTGLVQEDSFVSREMQRGIDLEPQALAAYEAETGILLSRCGFVSRTDIMAGCSPDAFVGDFEGVIECKCPKSATHYRYWKQATRRVPYEHYAQCLHLLWVTGAKWVDFISYDNRLPAHLQLYCARLERYEPEIENYAKEALRFLSEVECEATEMAKPRAA